MKTALVYAGIGALYFALHRRLLEISNNPAMARLAGRSVFLWDVIFYGTFGIVVTSSVRIAGVLLVFGLLVIPAVAGVMLSSRPGVRLAIGWSFAFLCSTGGLIAAFMLNTPAAPTILTAMTAALIVLGFGSFLRRREVRMKAEG